MMRQKLLHRMKAMCGATSRLMKDELIVGKHQVDGTRLIVYIYIFIHRCIHYIFLYIIFVSIIGCHFILCYINSFLYLQIKLYDTFSLSLSIMCNGYCAIE